ncbi:hypothetical protein L1987_33331 [Smallanthus sonchifolius]|uniref:Uncharacterized protein n=1 Tax=Smallanthus sonchifolius TaxID=185202 RepID=A0ACB9HRX4_9ASTR|nr:hypothetical protein L1987_33331 [Smallanthus sonchifolius]
MKDVTNDVEQVNFLNNRPRQQGPYSSTYMPEWRTHPNFGWKEGGSKQQPPGFNTTQLNSRPAQKLQYPPKNQYQGGGASQTKQLSLEDLIQRLFIRGRSRS